jgi:hypothetical protein
MNEEEVMPGFSLRNPHLIVVAALLLAILATSDGLGTMPVDVFPRIHIKAVRNSDLLSRICAAGTGRVNGGEGGI